MIPLYEGFKATTVWKAFILNSVISSLVILMALMVKDKLDTYTDAEGRPVVRESSFKSLAITLLITFLASFLAFTTMFILVDFGGGMLVDE